MINAIYRVNDIAKVSITLNIAKRCASCDLKTIKGIAYEDIKNLISIR